MKKYMIAVAGMILCTCVAAQAGYRTEVTVTPNTEAHQYIIQFKIMDVAIDGETKELASPLMAVQAGKEGTVSLVKDKDNGVFCTALVNEKETGIEAVTTVVVKEDGTEKYNNSQSITVKK